jgi:hypothetical protein
VFLDADAREKASETRMRLLNARKAAADKSPVLIAKLPDGHSDVGECTCDEAWDQVAAAMQCTREELKVDPIHVGDIRHPAELERRFRPMGKTA